MPRRFLKQFLQGWLPRKRGTVDAALRGVNGFTGRGEIEFTLGENGDRKLSVGLRGVAGRSAEVFADGALAATVNLDDGRADRLFDTRRGDAVPALTAGARIDIRQNGDVILEGVLTRD